MQVILTENVPQLGFVGDNVKVKPGFFRNFLYPNKLAVLANPSNVKALQNQKRQIEVKRSQKKSESEALKARLDKVSLTIERTVSEGGKLFGAVTNTEIVDGLKAAGFEIDKRWIKFTAPVRELGEFKAEVKLHAETTAWIPFQVVKKES